MSDSLAQFTVREIIYAINKNIPLLEAKVEENIKQWKTNIRNRKFKKFFFFEYIPTEEKIETIFEREYDWHSGWYSTGKGKLNEINSIKNRYANLSDDTIVYLDVMDMSYVFGEV